MPYLGYVLIFLICVGVALFALTRGRPRAYPAFLYLSGLGMLLTTTLAGPYLVGNDIHLEYYFAQLHSGMDVLPPLVGTVQGTTLGNNYLAPLIGKVIPLLWVYKLIFPLMFATVPVILYYFFQKWLTSKQAFLASFVFISFPAFSMEIPTVVRHLTTEIVIVTLTYIIFKSNLRHRYSIPAVVGLGALAALSYYTVAIMSLALFGVPLVVGLFLKRKRLLLVGGIVGIIVAGIIYYPIADGGAVALKLGHLYNAFAPEALQLDIPRMKMPMPVILTPNVVVGEEDPEGKNWEKKGDPGASTDVVEVTPPTSLKVTGVPYYMRLGEFTRSMIGLDWNEQDIWGKLFRVFQWLFILLVPIGLWRVRRNKELLMFVSGGILVLLFFLVPGYTGLLSATRIVHVALLVLAPVIVLAFKPKYLLVVLIPYFLFSSGFVFEVTQQPNIESITMPYNYGLSNSRIDLGIGASITDDDYRVRQFIYDNNLFPVYSDIQGADFMGEVVGWRGSWNRTFRTFNKLRDLPTGEVDEYIFVNSRVAKDSLFTNWSGAGRRVRVTPESLGIDINKNIIYQSGDSRVLKVER